MRAVHRGLTLWALSSVVRPPIVVQQLTDGPSSETTWREFRARLIAAEEGSRSSSGSPSNEARLRQQNRALWAEYRSGGAWAHPLVLPEVGGLLCALPLQGQLVHLLRHSQPSFWAEELRRQLLEELPAAADGIDSGNDGSVSEEARLARWSDNTAYVYRLATRMANAVLNRLGTSWRAPSPTERELWQMQQRALAVRAQVGLSGVQGSEVPPQPHLKAPTTIRTRI
jgi:hypothetical protein